MKQHYPENQEQKESKKNHSPARQDSTNYQVHHEKLNQSDWKEGFQKDN